MKRLWMAIWLAMGLYAIIAAVGGGGGFAATGAMLCGFMLGRNMADIVSSSGT